MSGDERGQKRQDSSTLPPSGHVDGKWKIQQTCSEHLPPVENYLSPACNVSKRGGESFSLLSEARLQQNAKPDLEHLEQLKQFLFLVNAAINWEIHSGIAFLPKKTFASRFILEGQVCF